MLVEVSLQLTFLSFFFVFDFYTLMPLGKRQIPVSMWSLKTEDGQALWVKSYLQQVKGHKWMASEIFLDQQRAWRLWLLDRLLHKLRYHMFAKS